MKRGSYTLNAVRAGQARMETGLSQVDAADRLQVNRVTLNRIENGRANVSLDLLERMTALYGRSREWLLGQDEPVDPIEAARGQLAAAFEKINQGFAELTDVLYAGVRDARAEQAEEGVTA